jgi:hypothetical protein
MEMCKALVIVGAEGVIVPLGLLPQGWEQEYRKYKSVPLSATTVMLTQEY